MIYYHHIGARSGTFPLRIPKPLLNDFCTVLYDADEDSIEQIKSKADGNVIVLSALIAGGSGMTRFYNTFHPTNFSIYKLNERYKNYSYTHYPRYGEYICGDGFSVESSIELKSYTLPEIIEKYQIGIDFLSLDVQGAEYDILVASKDLLKDKVLGVILEAEFVELYKNQKTFDKVHQLMTSAGFSLINIDYMGTWEAISLPVGFRGTGSHIFGDFIYVKDVEMMGAASCEDKLKCALFALMYANMGICVKLLKQSSNHFNKFDYGYARLLAEVWRAYQESYCYLPKFGELFTSRMIQNFYSVEKSNVFDDEHLIKQDFNRKFNKACEYISTIDAGGGGG
ncbi:MAG: FkbM family methyltransferase [Holosporales bacterium]|jgi:FkbM family methyltransferase|nr:FkbM family methyltransferase [Holosporales bacterium]